MPPACSSVAAACCEVTADLSIYERNAKLFVPALREMGYEVIEPQGAFYLFVKCPNGDDMAFMERAKTFSLLLVPALAWCPWLCPCGILCPDGAGGGRSAPV